MLPSLNCVLPRLNLRFPELSWVLPNLVWCCLRFLAVFFFFFFFFGGGAGQAIHAMIEAANTVVSQDEARTMCCRDGRHRFVAGCSVCWLHNNDILYWVFPDVGQMLIISSAKLWISRLSPAQIVQPMYASIV